MSTAQAFPCASPGFPPINQWLEESGLGDLLPQLLAAGIDNLLMCKHITDADLKEYGIHRPAKRRAFLAAVRSVFQESNQGTDPSKLMFVQTWQSEEDLPLRRKIISAVRKYLQAACDQIPDRACIWSKSIPHISQYVEGQLYGLSTSRHDYVNPKTLLERVQFVARRYRLQRLAAARDQAKEVCASLKPSTKKQIWMAFHRAGGCVTVDETGDLAFCLSKLSFKTPAEVYTYFSRVAMPPKLVPRLELHTSQSLAYQKKVQETLPPVKFTRFCTLLREYSHTGNLSQLLIGLYNLARQADSMFIFDRIIMMIPSCISELTRIRDKLNTKPPLKRRKCDI